MNAIENNIAAKQIANELDNGALPQGKVIYDGKIMTREEAIKLNDDAVAISRIPAFLDLQDLIDDEISTGPVRMKLRTNLTWGAAYRVINAARDLVYDMSSHATNSGHVDRFNDFVVAMNDAESAAQYAYDLGYDDYASGIRKLEAMYSLYNQWRGTAIHDYTITRAKVRNNDFPDLLMLCDSPRQSSTKNDPVAKLVAATEIMLEGEDKEVIEKAVSVTRLAAENKKKAQAANDRSIAPIMKRIISTLPNADVKFHELPLDTQASLLEALARSCGNLPEQLATMSSVSVTDVIVAMPQLRRLTKRVETILSDARFMI